LDEALALAVEAARPVERTEEVPLSEANGRVVAQEVRSEADVPPFDRAAMDGYAVRAVDTEKAPKSLTLLGRVLAGEEPSLLVEPGCCLAVATGAPMPAGADAVVMVEHTEAEGETIHIGKSVKAGKNMALRGEDIGAGDIVVEIGTILNPGRLGALAAVGRSMVSVYEKPTAAVIPTGEEIVPPGSGPLKPGQIYDINTTTLLAALREFGASVVGHPPVEDDMDSLRQAIAEAAEADLLVLTGGSSVGEKDLRQTDHAGPQGSQPPIDNRHARLSDLLPEQRLPHPGTFGGPTRPETGSPPSVSGARPGRACACKLRTAPDLHSLHQGWKGPPCLQDLRGHHQHEPGRRLHRGTR
jgi:molybdopterin biosynthesis enzyme